MASKKRGLSLEEKRQRMMEIFYTKKEFFLLKELEKIGPKEKGITSQSVKDVVQSLGEINLRFESSSMHIFAICMFTALTRSHLLRFIPVDDNLVDTDKIGTSVYFWSVSCKIESCQSCNPELACFG